VAGKSCSQKHAGRVEPPALSGPRTALRFVFYAVESDDGR
jgi:hypothetical protein